MRVALAWLRRAMERLRRRNAPQLRQSEAVPFQPGLLDMDRLRRDLPSALSRGDIRLVYQPKLRLRTGRIDSVEALARWYHPALGLIPPNIFVSLAEQIGSIQALTRHVVDIAIRDQRELAAGGHDLSIYVNMSGTILTDDNFTDQIHRLVVDAGAAIGLEITETALISDPVAAIRNLDRFAEAGMPVSIDDYGSGLSSLAYLKQLPAKELKIDKLFISNLTSSHRDPLIVRSTIDLAHALDMEVVAEGVESPASLALLRVMGCDVAQGFLISAGLPIAELRQFLQSYCSEDVERAQMTLQPPADFWRRA